MDLSLLSKYLSSSEERVPAKPVQILPVKVSSSAVLTLGTVLPLHIADETEERLVEELVEAESDLVLCYAPLGRDREMMMSSICGAGRLVMIDSLADGRKNVMLEGDYRVEILEIVEERPYLRAKVRWVPDKTALEREAWQEIHAEIQNLVRRWIFLMGQTGMEYASILNLFQYSHHLSDFIAGYFFPDYALKQKLLEVTLREKRVAMVKEVLAGGMEWFAKTPARSNIHSAIEKVLYN